MKQTIKKIVSEILDLEQKCQKGENVSENMKKIENIFVNLSPSMLFQVITNLEELDKSKIF